MGLVKMVLKSDVLTRAGGIFFHRATRRAKGKISEKMAVSAAAATAGVGAEMAVKQTGRIAENRLDENNNSSERWSLIGMFIPDSAMQKIGEFVLYLNPVNIGSKIAGAAIDATGRVAEKTAGLVSRKAAMRFRIARMTAKRKVNRIGRFNMSKRRHKRLAGQVAKGLDIAVAAAETVGLGGANIAGRVGAKVTTKVASSGFRWMARNAAKRAARETVRRSIGRTTIKAAAKVA